jgi:hypothetical protein
MDSFYFFPLLALGLAATVQYFLGSKKNRWLGKLISGQLEDRLKPKDTEYVNIGGVIGYNFVYKLRDPWKEAKGSFTFLPRHSLLYLPFALLVGHTDRFYINLFTDKRLLGEGHILDARHNRMTKIDGVASMTKESLEKNGKTFYLYWRDEAMHQALRQTLDAFPEPQTLSHFCCYDDNKTFFLFLRPMKGKVEANFAAFAETCSRYFR